jgi:hypothetical protein
MGRKRTAKRWSSSQVETLLNSGYEDMSSSQRYKFAKTFNRTVQALACKYYELKREVKHEDEAEQSTPIDLSKRSHKVTEAEHNTFMSALVNRAKSATIEGSKIHIYFD